MPQNFLLCDRDQVLLLPPSLSDWLDEDHLAWFVIDAVGAGLGAVFGRVSSRWVGCRGARSGDDGGVAGVCVCDRGALLAAARAALSGGHRVSGDHGQSGS